MIISTNFGNIENIWLISTNFHKIDIAWIISTNFDDIRNIWIISKTLFVAYYCDHNYLNKLGLCCLKLPVGIVTVDKLFVL